MLKKTFKIKFILIIFIALMLISPFCMASDVMPISSDATNEVANSTSDDSTTYEFIPSDVYEFNSDVVIDNIVDGNAFAFGNNITISGEIGGDVFAFGGNVTLTDTAYVHGSVFVFAENIIINGICYDVYGAGSTFTLGPNGIIARDLRLGADKTYINGNIKRDAHIDTNELVFPNDGTGLIGGNLNYSSKSEFTINDGVVVGNTNYTPETTEEASVSQKISSYISSILSSVLYSLAVVLLIIWLAPNFKDKATELLKKKSPLSLGVGLLASIIIVFASVLLLVVTRGLGFSISMAVIAIFILALTISKTVFSMGCAKLINSKCKKENNITFVLFTLLVVLVVSLLELIPYIGSLIGFLIVMIGLGIIVLNLIMKNKANLDNKSEVTSNSTEK